MNMTTSYLKRRFHSKNNDFILTKMLISELKANIPGIIVPSRCGSLVTVFSDRALGYRVFWGVAGVFSVLSLPVLVCFVKPGGQPGRGD